MQGKIQSAIYIGEGGHGISKPFSLLLSLFALGPFESGGTLFRATGSHSLCMTPIVCSIFPHMLLFYLGKFFLSFVNAYQTASSHPRS
jgi:hypothetical protein